MGTLSKLGVPGYLARSNESCLSKRLLWYKLDHGAKEYIVTVDVPQGSTSRPLLWNLMYDAVLGAPEKATLISFADDLVMVIVTKHLKELYGNGTILAVES